MTTTNNELFIIVTKANDGATTSVNATDTAPVTAVQLVNAGTVAANFCLNLLADRVDQTILNAINTRGGLVRLFGGKIADADVNALKKIVAVEPETRVAAWKQYVLQAKRIRGISIQGVAKAIAKYAKPAGNGEKFNLREELAAWVKAHDTGELPASLYDIFCDANLIAAEPAAKKPAAKKPAAKKPAAKKPAAKKK